jgi:hypothetical protein
MHHHPVASTAGFILQNLLPWQSQLLNQIASEHSQRTILTMLEEAETAPIIASDGSVRQKEVDRNTLAWVLAAADHGTPPMDEEV